MRPRVPGNERIERETYVAQIRRMVSHDSVRLALGARRARPVGASTKVTCAANQKQTSKSAHTSRLQCQSVCALAESSGANTARAARMQRDAPARGARAVCVRAAERLVRASDGRNTSFLGE